VIVIILIDGKMFVFKFCFITLVWALKGAARISCPKPKFRTTTSSLVAPISITLLGGLRGPNQSARTATVGIPHRQAEIPVAPQLDEENH
jgi:hypothetical protein